MIKKRLETIFRSGPSNTILFLGLIITVILLAINTFKPFAFERELLKIIAILLLTTLGEILYLKLEEKRPQPHTHYLKEAGIVSVFPRMKGDTFDSILARPGKKIILNTWIFNFADIQPLLKQSLKNSDTLIELNVLDPDSRHTLDRGNELKHKDIRAAITANLNDLSLFLATLTDPEKPRVKIYKFDSVPKISIYGCGSTAFVSFYWPGIHSADSPQFYIEGNEGYFSRLVWGYYAKLGKVEITEELRNEAP